MIFTRNDFYLICFSNQANNVDCHNNTPNANISQIRVLRQSTFQFVNVDERGSRDVTIYMHLHHRTIYWRNTSARISINLRGKIIFSK